MRETHYCLGREFGFLLRRQQNKCRANDTERELEEFFVPTSTKQKIDLFDSDYFFFKPVRG